MNNSTNNTNLRNEIASTIIFISAGTLIAGTVIKNKIEKALEKENNIQLISPTEKQFNGRTCKNISLDTNSGECELFRGIKIESLVTQILNIDNKYNKVSEIKNKSQLKIDLISIIREVNNILNNQKLREEEKNILNDIKIYVMNLLNDLIKTNNEFNIDDIEQHKAKKLNDSEILKAKQNIISTHQEEGKFYINDLLKYLDNPKDVNSQHYSISQIIDFMESNNKDSIQYNIKTGKIDYTTFKYGYISSSVIILKSKSNKLEKFLDFFDETNRNTIKSNTNYIIFFPGVISTKSNKYSSDSTMDVDGLYIGGGILYIDNSSEIFNTIAHEAKHSNTDGINIATLKNETIASFSGMTSTKFAINLLQKNNIPPSKKLESKINYTDLRLARSDYLMFDGLNGIFKDTYPYGIIYAGQLLRSSVTADNLLKIEVPGNSEIDIEFKAAIKCSLIALNPSLSELEKGEQLVKLMKNGNEDEKYSAHSALVWLFPTIQVNINHEDAFNYFGRNFSFDEYMKFHEGVIKGDIKINGTSINSGHSKGIYDIEIDGNIIDLSSSTGTKNLDIGGHVKVTGDYHSGDHTTTGKVNGNLTVEIGGKNLNLETGNLDSDSIEGVASKMSTKEKYKYLMNLSESIFNDVGKLYSLISNVSKNEIGTLITYMEKIKDNSNQVQYEFQSLINLGELDSERKNKSIEIGNRVIEVFNSLKEYIIVLKYNNGSYNIKKDLQESRNYANKAFKIVGDGNYNVRINNLINKYNTASSEIERQKVKSEFGNMLNSISPSINKSRDILDRLKIISKFNKNKEFTKLLEEMDDSLTKVWNSIATLYDQI